MGPPVNTSAPESSSPRSSGLRWKQQKQKWMRLLVTTIILLFNNGSGDRVRGCCHAKKRNRHAPHPHRGELTPYAPGPFALRLTADDEAKLARGDAIMKQILPDTAEDDAAAPSTQQQQQQQGGSAGSAICVQDVHAPIEAVWNQILDLNNYPNKVGKVQECRNYLVRKHSDGRVTIKTKQVLGVLPGYSYESYYDHTYSPDQSSLTWTLDYDKTSDFRDCVGHWHVTTLPNQTETATKTNDDGNNRTITRVYYACDIKLNGNPPKAIMNYISKAALKQATAWVKRESEAHPDEIIPAEYSGAATEQQEVPEKESVPAGAETRHGFWGRR